MTRLTVLAATVLLAASLPSACTSTPMPATPADAVEFVIVRHAEKAADAGDDPSLTNAGRARATALAQALAGTPVAAVYSTGYARTRETAQPTAAAHDLPVTPYDAREPADAFAGRLRAAHDRGTVLVVGHSNTVPGLVRALGAPPAAPMPESEFDRYTVVLVPPGGEPRVLVARY